MYTERKQMLEIVKPEIWVRRLEQETEARKLLKLFLHGKSF